MNNSVIDRSQSDYKPLLAIIVYAADHKDYYLETHEINDAGKMLEGTPLTEECITDLASGFSVEQSKIPHGVLPDNMIYCDLRIGKEYFVWYNPPCKRMMFFSDKLGIENKEYHVPGVIFTATQDKLEIYAYKGKLPKQATKLFNAPFFNVTGSSICLGSTKLEYPASPSFHEFMEYWEKRFWLTEFTHLGGGHNPTKNNLVTVTKASVGAFDYNELIPSQKTLKDLLR